MTEANGDVVSYGYDGQGHLTSESRTGASAYTTYVVDGAANQVSQTSGGVTTTFAYDADEELTATRSTRTSAGRAATSSMSTMTD